MVTAAALYDETAQQQVTSKLFTGANQQQRSQLRTVVTDMFSQQLNPDDGACRWTPDQQNRLRGFIDTVKALNPAPAPF